MRPQQYFLMKLMQSLVNVVKHAVNMKQVDDYQFTMEWHMYSAVLSQKLIIWIRLQMDGLARSNELVFVLAATNLPWELDAAMLRCLEKRVSFLYIAAYCSP